MSLADRIRDLFDDNDPAAEARRALADAEQTAGRCHNELRERRRQLSEAVDANRVDLDAENLSEQIDGAGTEAVRIATQIEAVEDACRRADARVVDARRRVLTVHADKLEAEAERLRAEAKRNRDKANDLRTKLEDVTGVAYIEDIHEVLKRMGYVAGDGILPGEEMFLRHKAVNGDLDGVIPRWAILEYQAQEFDERARKVRDDAASVDLSDRDAFVAELRKANPVGPEQRDALVEQERARSHIDAVLEAWDDVRQAAYDAAYQEGLERFAHKGDPEGAARNYAVREQGRVPRRPVANWTRPISELDPAKIDEALKEHEPADVFEALHGPRPTASQLRRARAS